MVDAPDWNTLVIIAGAATASAIAGFAISRQISEQGQKSADGLTALGNKFMAALTEHKTEDQEKFGDHATRLAVLEMSRFGFTHSGKNPDKMDPKTPLT